MILFDIVKGAFWVAGKVVQGTAYVASEAVKDTIGVDIYGTVKDAVDASKAERDLNEVLSESMSKNSEGIEKKREELEKKQEELKSRALKQHRESFKKYIEMIPDSTLLKLDMEKIKSHDELNDYRRELYKRNLDRRDEEFLERDKTLENEL